MVVKTIPSIDATIINGFYTYIMPKTPSPTITNSAIIINSIIPFNACILRK